MLRIALTALLAVLTASACSSNSGPTLNRPDAVSDPLNRTLEIPSSRFAELNLQMPTGTTSSAVFSASGDLEWNTHSHPSGDLVIHTQGVGREGTLALASDSDGIYSYLWENKSGASIELSVEITISSGVTIDSWVP
jgi:hypothetical protein